MIERVIMAGAGGQGMMLLGKVVAWIMMEEGGEVTYFPSYGAEVRGGSAHCHVVFSDEPIHSPVVERADTLILLNQPSYDRFHERLKPGGLLLANESMVNLAENGAAERILLLPATLTASQVGDVRTANTYMLGAYTRARAFAPKDNVWAGLSKALSGSKATMRDVNQRAFEAGWAAADEAMGE
jgi:2-oxoglutarate ferredoxin oxidoreductase subunit gamma